MSALDRDDDWVDLRRAAGGDAAAFERLVTRHQDRLFRLCMRLLQRRAEAEEAVQEVFLRLYRRAGAFEPRGQLFTLLYRMGSNYCLNRLRRRQIVRFLPLERRGDGDDQWTVEPEDPAPDPGRRVESQARWRGVQGAIERLPPGQRAVLLLVKLEGLSYKETAAALGITIGAVESRLFRAMRRLEDALPAFEGEEKKP